jgi:1,2-diacylglycerol 3-beta-glucosyltransferase
MVAIDILLVLVALPVLACAAYLFFLAAFATTPPPPPYPAPHVRFAIVVPAHDEEAGIKETVGNLLRVDYPDALRKVVVVADNCTDATAAEAEVAGAMVVVREDASKRGKGYALERAFEILGAEQWADAFVVVDADTVVSSNLLQAFAARIDIGARALQAEYGVRNPDASPRTRLMVLALALFHTVRSLARERLRLSAGLRGNGMCFDRRLLEEVPHDAFSIVEDLEYGIRLGRAGHRVWYVHEASVTGEMPENERVARSQRRRWEGGRWAIAKKELLPLAKAGLKEKSPVLLDLAMDVAVPPLTVVALAAGLGSLVSFVWAYHHSALPAYVFGLSLYCVLFYVARGWAVSGLGVRGLATIAYAPVYVAWKIGLLFGKPGRAGGSTWVRTRRRNEEDR